MMQTPSSLSSKNAFLLTQARSGKYVDRLRLQPPFRIGRMEGFDLWVDCPNVSALHAEIIEEDGGLWICDLESTNGTFVNGKRIGEKSLLHHNDTMQFGSRVFRVVSGETMDGSADDPSAAATAAPADTQEQRFQNLLDNAVPHFQPIYEIAKSQRHLIGFEVFGRSSVSGLQTPGKMFAAALSLSMESELSRFFRQLGLEVAHGKIPDEKKLFVNTHPAELNRNNLEDSLRELRESFSNRPIVLELCAAYLVDPDSISHLRKLLKSLEIELALHNFGVGMLPVTELNDIAPDYVKFDPHLTNGINTSTAKDQLLVRALVKMVKELGITPMAEAVESPDDDQTLTQLGFEFAQGFHYGRPNDIDKIELAPVNQEVESNDINEPTPRPLNQRPIDLVKEIESSTQNSSDDQKEAITKVAHTNREKIVKDTQWLMRQPDDHYTIQLTMLQTQSSAVDFINEQKLAGEYAWYHRMGRSKNWYIVLCGSFEKREKAKLASERFKEVGIMPLVRRLSAVQHEVSKNQRTVSETNTG